MRGRARLLILSMLATFVVTRGWLAFSPDMDLTVFGYGVHHMYSGILLLTACLIPLLVYPPRDGRRDGMLLAGTGIGLSLVLDELVYLVTTDGSNASYWLPVSVIGAVAVQALAVIYTLSLDARRSRSSTGKY